MNYTEDFTEEYVKTTMNFQLGENEEYFVYPQSSYPNKSKIYEALYYAGGKPKTENIDYIKSKSAEKKAKPEFIIEYKKNQNTIIVIECKKNISKHSTKTYSNPQSYACDGVLYYAKYLKQYYNVIAIAVSGTEAKKMKNSTFYWKKGEEYFNEWKDVGTHIFEPMTYIQLLEGKQIEKEYSVNEIRELALIMHENLRELGVTEKEKPLFIASILIALKDENFRSIYRHNTTVSGIVRSLEQAIDVILDKDSGIKREKITYIKNALKQVGKNETIKNISLANYNSILWYIEELEMKILPMMKHSNTVDALGEFYHEFIKYSGGDGKGLGIVLTPQHITEFMVDIAELESNMKVIDPTCGSGSFLVTAMNKLISKAERDEQKISKIKREGLHGVELQADLYTLALTNMIVRGDGKSNIHNGSCFDKKIHKELPNDIDVGLINPPYSQKDSEIKFIDNMLDVIRPGGLGIAIVPQSSAIGNKFKEDREVIMSKHTLEAVFTMPDDLFHPTAVNTCVMVWKAGRPHNPNKNTYFGLYKNDGYVKKHQLGRIDSGNWDTVKNEWLQNYFDKTIIKGTTMLKKVSDTDEWLPEAYIEVDYKSVDNRKFTKTINDYVAFMIKNFEVDFTKVVNNKKSYKLSTEYKAIRFGDYFKVDRGKVANLTSLVEGTTPIVSSYGENQGISFFGDVPVKYENCITASLNGSKTGYFAYHNYQFNANTDCGVITSDKFEINKYTGLYLATILKEMEFKFQYGRKLSKTRLGNEIIELPIDSKGNFAYDEIEKYMKQFNYIELI